MYWHTNITKTWKNLRRVFNLENHPRSSRIQCIKFLTHKWGQVRVKLGSKFSLELNLVFRIYALHNRNHLSINYWTFKSFYMLHIKCKFSILQTCDWMRAVSKANYMSMSNFQLDWGSHSELSGHIGQSESMRTSYGIHSTIPFWLLRF